MLVVRSVYAEICFLITYWPKDSSSFFVSIYNNFTISNFYESAWPTTTCTTYCELKTLFQGNMSSDCKLGITIKRNSNFVLFLTRLFQRKSRGIFITCLRRCWYWPLLFYFSNNFLHTCTLLLNKSFSCGLNV